MFFFKQKTAYEMRISDWSSDVCSSDLLSGRPGIAEREAAQDSLLDGLAGNLACFHHRQVGMNEIAGANTQRDRQLFLASDLVELGEIDDLDISHASGGDRRPRYPPLRFPRSPFDRKSAFDLVDQFTPDRSEEHTSEFQSLMRIS